MKITREELFQAYYDCRKHKRYTYQAYKFELNYFSNLEKLYQELINDTYKPSPEVVFIIYDSKVREVFAADFRDRIVHHLFINRIKIPMEQYLSNVSYNCRPNRGNLHACQQLQKYMQQYESGYVVGLDVKSFFTSINREQTLYDWLRFIDLYVESDKVSSTKQLANIILTNDVTINCKRVSKLKEWNNLSKEKSLFNKNSGYPIGDVTSQFSANFILNFIDNLILYKNFKVIRYADDLRIIGENKNQLKKLIQFLFKIFPTSVKLQLNPNKIIFQNIKKGIPFVGYFVKQQYLLPGKRLKSKIKQLKNPSIEQINSYKGFIKYCRAYNLLL